MGTSYRWDPKLTLEYLKKEREAGLPPTVDITARLLRDLGVARYDAPKAEAGDELRRDVDGDLIDAVSAVDPPPAGFVLGPQDGIDDSGTRLIRTAHAEIDRQRYEKELKRRDACNQYLVGQLDKQERTRKVQAERIRALTRWDRWVIRGTMGAAALWWTWNVGENVAEILTAWGWM